MIFKLPEELGKLATPLAYVRWFRKFTSKDETVDMYKVAPSTRKGRENSSIVPITHIARSCHLAPVFGETMDRSLTSKTALEDSPAVFLNPYLRHLDFFLLRHLDAAGDETPPL